MATIDVLVPPKPWLPLQQDASDLTEDHQYVLYGGSRGPGKSYWLRWDTIADTIYLGMNGHPGVVTGLFCETFPELKRRQISNIELEVPRFLGVVKDSKAHGLGLHLHEKYGGGVMVLGNLDDASKYQSSQFAAISVDELTKNTYETFELLRGSLRWPGIPRPRFRGATNPGGIGHLWVKSIWIDSDFSAFSKLLKIKDQFAFVRALPDDNPFLPPEYYEEVLGSLGADLEAAWRYGSWTSFAGQVFKEWRHDLHVCKPFSIPEFWPRRRALDPGYSKPACALWDATDPHNGRIFIYREAYGPGITDQDIGRTVARASLNEVYEASYSDPALWQPKNMNGVITSGADELAAEGVVFAKGDNKRLSGKAKVHRGLAPPRGGEPGLKVFETCKNLIRTLPALVYSTKAGSLEDVDTAGEDHAYDALKYLLSDLAPGEGSGDNGPDAETKAWMHRQSLLAKNF